MIMKMKHIVSTLTTGLLLMTAAAAPVQAAESESDVPTTYPHLIRTNDKPDRTVDLTTGKIESGKEYLSVAVNQQDERSPVYASGYVSTVHGAKQSDLKYEIEDPTIVMITSFNGNTVSLLGLKTGWTVLKITKPDGTSVSVKIRAEEYVNVTCPGIKEPYVRRGDVNYDYAVNVLDVIRINKSLLGAYELTGEEAKIADADKDGTVTANDSLLILKYALEVIETYDPVE
jgi:hypothetical protein